MDGSRSRPRLPSASIVSRSGSTVDAADAFPAPRPPGRRSGGDGRSVRAGQRREMLRHGIALVGLETVARAILRQRAHQPVARHLGDDRGRRDRQDQPVAADHGVAVAGDIEPVAAVDEHMLRRFRQRLHRARQRPQRGAQDIVAIDPRRRAEGDRERRGGADFLEQFLAALGGQPLGIVDALRESAWGRAPRRRPPPGPPAGRGRPRRSRPPARRRA